MSAKAPSPITHAKSPCGCGGSSTSSRCTCGAAECATCQDQGFIRPLFFAGQLLTEDDLQSLTDYVVGKNRLHNRYLFGPGVVCGLQVSRDACVCGQVTVNPGYALDCCGNDIVLSCPKKLDINKMVRQLLIKLRGQDCGDPCAGKTTTGTNGSTGTAASGAASGNGSATSAGDSTASADDSKKYCLYINYCEQPSDPVSPYATDSPCGQSPTCEPTRVHEGFYFELRCPEKECCEPEICTRLCQCHPPDKTTKENYTLLREFGTTTTRALTKMRGGVRPRPSYSVLEQAVLKLKGSPFEDETEKLRTFAQSLRGVLVTLAPYLSGEPPEKKPDLESGEFLREVVELVDRDGKRLRERRAKFENDLWRSYADALSDLSEMLTKELEGFERGERAARRKEFSAVDPQLRLLAFGAVVTPAHMKNCIVALRDLQAWLEQCEQECGQATAPKSSKSTSRLTGFVIDQPLNLSDVGTVAQETDQIVNCVCRCVKECICNALIPPCHSCDDTGVLLACVTVKDCCVTEICNLDRDFVLSPVAVRYWIPEIQKFGEAIEEYCCPSGCEEYDEPLERWFCREGDEASLLDVLGRGPALAEWAICTLLRACKPNKGRRFENHAQNSLLYRMMRLAEVRPETAQGYAVEQLVDKAGAGARHNLESALAELEKMKAEQSRLQQRLAKLEKRQKDNP